MTNIPDEILNMTFAAKLGDDKPVREPRDWWPCEPKIFVYHVPTRATFEVLPKPGAARGEPLPIGEFVSRLAHVCDGYPIPSIADLQRIGSEAVLMGMCFVSLGSQVEPAVEGDQVDLVRAKSARGRRSKTG